MMMETHFLTGIEKDLSVYLKPVDPDPEFVQTLGSRLSRPQAVILERRQDGIVAGVLVVLALVCGAFLLWTLRRG